MSEVISLSGLCKLDFDDICTDIQWVSGCLCHRLCSVPGKYCFILPSALLPPEQTRQARQKEACSTGNSAPFKLRDLTPRCRLPSTIPKKQKIEHSVTNLNTPSSYAVRLNTHKATIRTVQATPFGSKERLF